MSGILIIVLTIYVLIFNGQGGLDDGGAATVRAIMHWQYRTISRGKNSILHNLSALLGPKANDCISFYGLRTHGKLSDGGPFVTSQVLWTIICLLSICGDTYMYVCVYICIYSPLLIMDPSFC